MEDVLMLKIFSWIIGGACFLAGIGFLFFAKAMKKASQIMNKTFYPMQDLDKFFNKEVTNDQWIASNTKVLGIISLLVSIVFFVLLLTV